VAEAGATTQAEQSADAAFAAVAADAFPALVRSSAVIESAQHRPTQPSGRQGGRAQCPVAQTAPRCAHRDTTNRRLPGLRDGTERQTDRLPAATDTGGRREEGPCAWKPSTGSGGKHTIDEMSKSNRLRGLHRLSFCVLCTIFGRIGFSSEASETILTACDPLIVDDVVQVFSSVCANKVSKLCCFFGPVCVALLPLASARAAPCLGSLFQPDSLF